jgi:hypothetical protein
VGVDEHMSTGVTRQSGGQGCRSRVNRAHRPVGGTAHSGSAACIPDPEIVGRKGVCRS